MNRKPEREKFKVEKFKKIEEKYFKQEADRFRESIVRLEVEGWTHHVAFAEKEIYYFCDYCQLIASIDSNGEQYLGYAFNSDGFPYLPRQPLFEEMKNVSYLSKVYAKGQFLCLQLDNSEKEWKFKFENK